MRGRSRFDEGVEPQLTPVQMLAVFGGKYMTDWQRQVLLHWAYDSRKL